MLSVMRKLTDILVTTLFIMLVVIVFIQVLCRMVSVSFPFADELSRYSFVWLIYMGGTITIRKGMNITFDVFLDALPKRVWKVVFTIVNLASCAFLTMAVVLGSNLAWINRIQSSSVVKLNMGLVMMAIPLGGLLMLFEQISFYLKKMKEADHSAQLTEGGEK